MRVRTSTVHVCMQGKEDAVNGPTLVVVVAM